MKHRQPMERRGRDTGPPRGCFERRRNAERRLPVAEEASVSDADFEIYFGAMIRHADKSDYALELAADVLGNVRDR